MGAFLPTPVETIVTERQGNELFNVGIAEMNGWRRNMEDAHLVHMKSDWGFFGLFDGHYGDKCSKYVAARLREVLENEGCPLDDIAATSTMLRVDHDFLETKQDGGSTGTCVIVHPPFTAKDPSDKFTLRVINIGDSRVLLGRPDGSIVDGGGTDQGLTVDHKPDHPVESARIYRCGGTVEAGVGNVARVNGDLSVSRCFGDAKHKKTGGPGPEDHPITSNPQLHTFECEGSEFLVLVCDGISEGNFPNAEVVKLAAESLRETGDPGDAAKKVCCRALEADSKDNLSCMIVLLKGHPRDADIEFYPGPMAAPQDAGFRKAYEAMAQKAGFTFPMAAEMRHELLENILTQAEADIQNTSMFNELKAEMAVFGTPPGESGSRERTEWFQTWYQNLSAADGVAGNRSQDSIDSIAQEFLDEDAPATGGRLEDETGDIQVRVLVPDEATLRKAVEDSESAMVEWEPAMSQAAGQEGTVSLADLRDTSEDATATVNIPSMDMEIWLPTRALKVLDTLPSTTTPTRYPAISTPPVPAEPIDQSLWFHSNTEKLPALEPWDSFAGHSAPGIFLVFCCIAFLLCLKKLRTCFEKPVRGVRLRQPLMHALLQREYVDRV